MSQHVFTTEAACDACNATGVYVGMAERDGGAVRCTRCKGTGKRTLRVEWDDFEGRVRRDDVRRVVEANPGICIGEGNGHELSDFGGIPYEDFQEDKPFPPGSEMRRFTCPAWWYQSVDYRRKPKWAECIAVGIFSSCKLFGEKHKCWERFDREDREQ